MRQKFTEGHNRLMETQISKSQKRALEILKLAPTSDYQVAAKTLERAGYLPQGIPVGHSWRTAAKLSDADLIAGITVDYKALADSVIDRD
jgi:hypothetical protein